MSPKRWTGRPGHGPRRPGTRWAAAGLGVLVALVASAAPAAADPARPTNYRSRVLTTRPVLPAGVGVQVVGGDGFLELRDVGHEVQVLDQVQDRATAARPYLRIQADGTVQLNQSSIGYYTNRTRYGAGNPPASIQRPGGLPPRWQTVGHDGRYLWHDHRIHWMAPGKPPSVRGRSGKVDMGGPNGDWIVRLVVDGRPVEVIGDLHLYVPPSPLPWVALAVVSGAAVVVASRVAARRAATLATLLAAGLAVVVGWEQHLAVPAAAGGSPLFWVLPAVALAAAVVASVLRGASSRSTALLAGSAALAGWVFMRWTVLTHAVLPTRLAAPLDRAGTSLALGAAAAVAIVVVRSGGLLDPAPGPVDPTGRRDPARAPT